MKNLRSLFVCLLVYSFSGPSHGAVPEKKDPITDAPKTFAANITSLEPKPSVNPPEIKTTIVHVTPSSKPTIDNTSTVAPTQPAPPTTINTTLTQAPTTQSTPIVSPATTKADNTTTPIPAPKTTEVVPPVTTKTPPVSTEHTIIPSPRSRFDGPSFVGGIVLTVGLVAMGFIGFKYYKARTDRNYHTL